MNNKLPTVSIRPGVRVYSSLRHINYKPWFALAEFVDNSLQSYLANKELLKGKFGPRFKLKVEINVEKNNPQRIVIRDNAAGIAPKEFPRAFKPAEIPLDQSGLSEFGMGMKSAAIWFSPRWSVRTKAIGEANEHIIHFDLTEIIDNEIEELSYTQRDSMPDAHFTEVVLETPDKIPQKKTLAKIKDHLSDIYRIYIRDGELSLHFNNEELQYNSPKILESPYFREPDGNVRRWSKEINFDLGGNLSVRGFAAIMDPGSKKRSGFALFRRKRLIQGSADEGYRPEMIFGQSGNFRWLRLYGELHLDGFSVSHTKDGFRWDENEEPFLELLKEHLESGELPILQQAEGHRSRAQRNAENNTYIEKAVESTASALKNSLPSVLPIMVNERPVSHRETKLEVDPLPAYSKQFEIPFNDESWSISIEVSVNPAQDDWLEIADQTEERGASRHILIVRLSLEHPFMRHFSQAGGEEIEPLLRLAAGIAISEKASRLAGVKLAGTLRRNLNQLLKESLSRL